jgi:hypothetical protein
VEDGGSGMAAWLRLKIHTREPEHRKSGIDPLRDVHNCSVCLGYLSLGHAADQDASMAESAGSLCSHRFHAKCLGEWKAAQQEQGRVAECPVCRLTLQ